jgi:hypothetical protein
MKTILLAVLALSAQSSLASESVLEGVISFGSPTSIRIVLPAEGSRGEIVIGADHLPLDFAAAQTYTASFSGERVQRSVQILMNPAVIKLAADQSAVAFARDNHLLNAQDFKCTYEQNAYVWYVTEAGVYANCAVLTAR